MKAFTTCEGAAAPLMLDNIDTDLIIRIERIAQLKRGELGRWAFEALRYRADGSENPDFVLNQRPFRNAPILLAGSNFGCGSSREMAVWSLEEAGIRCIIAPSFGDIFLGNCLQNGLLPISMERDAVERLAKASAVGADLLRVDLQSMVIASTQLGVLRFDLPATQREALLSGLDEVDHTLMRLALIQAFHRRDRVERSWAYMPTARLSLHTKKDK